MKSMFRKLTGFKNRLTQLNHEEPVTKLALVVILLLDLFVLSIVFRGLDDHTQQLTSPTEYFPYTCRQVFISNDWTAANKIDRLQQLVLVDYNNYSYQHDSPLNPSKANKMHPLCGEMFGKIRAIAEHPDSKQQFIERQNALKNKTQLVRQYDKENEVYDTKLLETIADKNDGDLNSMAVSMKAKGREIDRLNAHISELNKAINTDPLVADFWTLARPGDAAQREVLIGDLNRYEKIYLFRELLWQSLFLLTLLAVSILWHSKSMSRSRNIQALISAHLIIVAAIPIILKVIELVLELIPNHFFQHLFEWLERLRIIALWHYFVIILAIGGGLFSVFLIQKKMFSKERLQANRLAKGACHSCGKKVPDRNAPFCPFCGKPQFRQCPECNTLTPVGSRFCVNCGTAQQPC